METDTPLGYIAPPEQLVTIPAGEVLTLTITNEIGGKVVITKVDPLGQPVTGACFQVNVDVGDGQIGNQVDTACDVQEGRDQAQDGVVTLLGLDTGDHVLTEYAPPPGYIPAPSQRLHVDRSETVNIRLENRLGGTLLIHKVDEHGQPLFTEGGLPCFALYHDAGGGVRGDIVAGSCDGHDESADGTTILDRLPTGDYLLAESVPVPGYVRAADRQVHVTEGQTFEITIENEPGGTVVVRKEDDLGLLITGACFELFTVPTAVEEPALAAEGCDADDERDGMTTLRGGLAGNYSLHKVAAPDGYQGASPQTVTVSAGQQTTVAVVNTPSPGTGALRVVKVNRFDQSVAGACFQLFTDAGDGVRGDLIQERCDAGDVSDGSTIFTAVEPGDYVVGESIAPGGYRPADDVRASVITEHTTRVDVVDDLQSGLGLLELHKVDGEGAPLTGACFTVFTDAGDGTPGSYIHNACGGPTFTLFLSPGAYIVLEEVPPSGYVGSAGQPAQAEEGRLTALTFANHPGATLTVHKVDETGEEIPGGACFQIALDAGNGEPNGFIGEERCGQPAVLTGIDTGSYVLVETVAPAGYFAGDPVPFTITRGESREVTVVNTRAATVTVHKFDTEGNPLGNVCFALYSDAGDGSRGNFLRYECNFFENVIVFGNVAAGDYVLVESSAPDGYFPGPDVPFHIELGETKSFDVINERQATVIIHKVDEAGNPVTGSCFEIVSVESAVPAGTPVAHACDATQANNGTLTLTGPATGIFTLIETQAPSGYLPISPLTLTIAGGETRELTIVNRKGGTVVVHKVDQRGQPLGGACFAVFHDAGGGELGPFAVGACDSATGPDDGVIVLTPLETGRYVLVEQHAPPGYEPAANRPFQIRAGQTRDVTVVNQANSTIIIHKVDASGRPLAGSCFTLAQDTGRGVPGEHVAAACDGDAQPDDGEITMNNIPAGRYVLIESTVPPGYSGAEYVRVRLAAGETAAITVQNVPIPGTLVIYKVDHRNQPLAGACFGVFWDAGNGMQGGRIASACDEADGASDGITTFPSMPAGSVIVIEQRAPRGYQRAAAVTVVIPSGGEITVTIQNQPRQPEPSPTPEGLAVEVATPTATPIDTPASSDVTPAASASPSETPAPRQDEPPVEPTAVLIAVSPATPEP